MAYSYSYVDIVHRSASIPHIQKVKRAALRQQMRMSYQQYTQQVIETTLTSSPTDTQIRKREKHGSRSRAKKSYQKFTVWNNIYSLLWRSVYHAYHHTGKWNFILHVVPIMLQCADKFLPITYITCMSLRWLCLHSWSDVNLWHMWFKRNYWWPIPIYAIFFLNFLCILYF